MPLVRLVAAIASLATALACYHQVSADTNFYGCKDLPLIGPQSHLDVRLAQAPDSQLQARGSARLILIVSWSSDSLARHSHPTNALVQIDSTTRSFLVTDSAGRAGAVELPVPPDSYRLLVRLIGSQTLDTAVPVRQGYPDTARVYLQSGGMTICA
jgi:hypothetical protein